MKKITPSKVVVLIVTILWVFVGIFPLIWMISSATKDNAEVQAVPPKLIPTVPNELYFTLDYSDMEWEPDEIKAQIKRDFVNVLIGYPMEFSNIHNSGAHICATYNGRMLAKAHMASFERAEAVLDTKIYAIKAIPLTFERKIDELFPYTDTDFYFNSEVEPESPKTYTNEATAEITAFYADYGLRGTVTAVGMKDNPLRLLDNFISAWKVTSRSLLGVDVSFGRFILNSVIVTFFGIAGALLISSLGAYSLSKLMKRKTAAILLLFYLGTIMIPGIMTLIPTYELFKGLNLLNTLPCLFIGAWFAPMTVYFFKGFFDELPKELMESAKIDGASELRIFVSMVVPLSKPVFSAMTIMSFIPIWNDFLWPFLTVQEPTRFTYAVALYRMTQHLSAVPNQSMALSCIAAIPTTIIFILFQKAIQKGVVFSGIKG